MAAARAVTGDRRRRRGYRIRRTRRLVRRPPSRWL